MTMDNEFTLKIQEWLDDIGLLSEKESEAGIFDFETKPVLLNSGYEMPIMGFGTYSLDYDTCVNSVKTLLGKWTPDRTKCGFRYLMLSE